MREADGVSAAPRDKWELNNPIQLATHVVVWLPVPVQGERHPAGFINAQDVRLNAVTKVDAGVNLENGSQTVLVIGQLLSAFNFVVGYGRLAKLQVGWRTNFDVSVHAGLYAPSKFHFGDVLNVRLSLGRVKVRRGKRQIDVVDWNEF